MIPILSGNVASALPTGYNVDNSIRFNDGDSAFLSKTFSGAGTRTKYTISVWVKRAAIGSTQCIFSAGTGANNSMTISFNGADNRLYWNSYSNDGANYDYFLNTTRRFRDVSAWYHIVCAFDSTQGTSSNRQKIYINGVQETVFTTETYSGSYSDYAFNNILHEIGQDVGAGSRFFDGYMAEFCAIDGLQLAPTDFGEYDEDSPTIWKPKDVSGLTFGTNGFYLDFENSSELGTDVSGNSNTFTENNLDATDQATDTCTNNFCTMNPLQAQADDLTFAQGNLKITNTGNAWRSSYGTFGSANGKFYFEVKCQASSDYERFGIVDADAMNKQSADGRYDDVGYNSRGYGYGSDGQKTNNGGSPSWGNAWGAGDILGCAFDLTNGKLYFSKNGTFQESGDPTSGSTGTGSAYDIDTGYVYIPALAHYGSGSSMEFNFGGCPSFSISSGNADANGYGNFEYAPPTGYYALCTKNLAEYGG